MDEKTITHPETGAVLRRSVRRRKLQYKGVERECDRDPARLKEIVAGRAA